VHLIAAGMNSNPIADRTIIVDMSWRFQAVNTALLKLVLVVLAIIFLMLQYRLWFANGNIRDTRELQLQVQQQALKNKQQQRENSQLRAEIHALKNDPKEVEARAREELGLVKSEETYFMLVE